MARVKVIITEGCKGCIVNSVNEHIVEECEVCKPRNEETRARWQADYDARLPLPEKVRG
jgi:hypothetical protein